MLEITVALFTLTNGAVSRVLATTFPPVTLPGVTLRLAPHSSPVAMRDVVFILVVRRLPTVAFPVASIRAVFTLPDAMRFPVLVLPDRVASAPAILETTTTFPPVMFPVPTSRLAPVRFPVKLPLVPSTTLVDRFPAVRFPVNVASEAVIRVVDMFPAVRFPLNDPSDPDMMFEDTFPTLVLPDTDRTVPCIADVDRLPAVMFPENVAETPLVRPLTDRLPVWMLEEAVMLFPVMLLDAVTKEAVMFPTTDRLDPA